MALKPDITYEVLALRYGIFDGRLQFQNYIIPDDHAAPDPLDFYVFAIRGNGRTIVMDTGFNPVSAKRRGRELLRTPAEALLQAGVDPAEAPDVVLTHMHWDHAGGIEYFPKATFHLQASEMAYCTGPCMCRRFCAARSTSTMCRARCVRCTPIGCASATAPAEIAPGITLLHLIGGHSGASSRSACPRSAAGWCSRATPRISGATSERMTVPVVVDVARMLEGL